MGNLLTAVFGTKSDRVVKKLFKDVEQINSIFEELKDVPDDYFSKRTAEFKEFVSTRSNEAAEAGKDEELSPEEFYDLRIEAESEALEELLHVER